MTAAFFVYGGDKVDYSFHAGDSTRGVQSHSE